MNRADEALTSANLSGTIAVVIFTDGEPNCETAPATLNSLAAQWLDRGIKTYVVGLPGTAAASGLLNDLAVAGGTDNYAFEPRRLW
jgi:Mg-chelatase subunit ChlD